MNLNQWGGCYGVWTFSKMVEWDYKKTERGVPHMLAPRRRCLAYSKVVMSEKGVTGMESKQTYYILHITYTNSEISIGLLYIRPHFVWWHRPNHCVTLVRNFLPTSILVRASVSLLKFHTSAILTPLWFTNSERCEGVNETYRVHI